MIQSGDTFIDPVLGDPPKRWHADVPPFAGRHLWTASAVFKMDNPAPELHRENASAVIFTTGALCWYCGRPWGPRVREECTGDVVAPDEDDVDTIAALYLAGWSIRRIAAVTDASYGFVRWYLLHAGIELRGRGGGGDNHPDRRRSSPQGTADR